MGAKTKYEGEKTDHFVFENVRDRGLNNSEIAQSLGIRDATFYRWIQLYPSFSEAVKKGRELAIGEVENQLFKEAVGYWIEETKTYIQENKNGEHSKRIEKTKKWIRPSVTAQIFITKNRKPEKWSDRQEVNLQSDQTIVVDIVD